MHTLELRNVNAGYNKETVLRDVNSHDTGAVDIRRIRSKRRGEDDAV